MWTADDLHEGDYVICKNEDDRTRMHLALRRADIWAKSDMRLLGRKTRPVLRVMQVPCHKGYDSEEFAGQRKEG